MVLSGTSIGSVFAFSLSEVATPLASEDRQPQSVCLHLPVGYAAGGEPLARQLRQDVAAILAQHPDGLTSEALVGELSGAAAQGRWQPTLRQALGAQASAATTTSCFRELRHTFVCVHAGAQQYIVDVRFKDSFLIGRAASAAYDQMLGQVDDVFVGTAEQLQALVMHLAREMATSFTAMGLTLPPWRRCSALLTKWLPPRCTDMVIQEGPDAARTASPARKALGPPALLGSSAVPATNSSASAGTSAFADGAALAPQRAHSSGSSGSGSPFNRIADNELAKELQLLRSASSSLSRLLSVGRARSASDTGAQAPNQASGELTGRGSLDVQAPMHRELPPTYLVRLGRQASPR